MNRKALDERAMESNVGAADAEKINLITGLCVVVWESFLGKRKPAQNGREGKFSITVALSKKDESTKQISKIIKQAVKESYPGSRNLFNPIKDGDKFIDGCIEGLDEDLTEEEIAIETAKIEDRYKDLKGCIYFSANTNFELNEDGKEAKVIDGVCSKVDPLLVGSGSKVSLLIQLGKFDATASQGKKGITLYLQGVQVFEAKQFVGTSASSAFGSMGVGLGSLGTKDEKPELETPSGENDNDNEEGGDGIFD